MTKILTLLASMVFLCRAAHACPGSEPGADGACHGNADHLTAAHVATTAALLGTNCSFTTGLMARRVLEVGDGWARTSTLVPIGNDLESRVAAPFVIAGEGAVHVIANELLQELVQAGTVEAQLALTGRVLEVDGVRYVVLTSFQVVNT